MEYLRQEQIMKLPRPETNWRPMSEYRGNLRLNPAHRLLEVYNPATPEDAIKYVGNMGLQQVADYDGHPNVQADIIREQACQLFPHLFDVELDLTTEQDKQLSIVEACTRSDGSTDWNAVARRTTYAVSVTALTD